MSGTTDRWRDRAGVTAKRAEAAAKRAEGRFAEARQRGGPVDYVAELYERDRDVHGSVLGSAIALRLFLFVIPATVALVSLVNVLGLASVVEDPLSASVTTGSISTALTDQSWWKSLSFLISSSLFTLYAGYSLSKVLAACAGNAWQLTVRESKPKPLAVVALTGVLVTTIASGSIFDRLRDVGGVPAALTAWLAVMSSTGLAWFVVMFFLPRRVSDPGALLPGAALVGLCYSALQWFMQYYLPNKIERTSDTFGDMATTVALLGNFFFVGRIMSYSFVVTAVVYERSGSLSQLVFALPGLRSVARKSPKLRGFFSLDPADEAAAAVEPLHEADATDEYDVLAVPDSEAPDSAPPTAAPPTGSPPA